VVGPLRSGKSINLGEGVLLWGDLHKDAVIKALCVIVMGRLQARLLSLRFFVLMKQSEGASVQVAMCFTWIFLLLRGFSSQMLILTQ